MAEAKGKKGCWSTALKKAIRRHISPSGQANVRSITLQHQMQTKQKQKPGCRFRRRCCCWVDTQKFTELACTPHQRHVWE